MTDAEPRSSAALRQEMAALDLDLSALDGRLSSCDAQVRAAALLARRGDAGAVAKVAEARAKKVAIGVEVDLMAAAKVQLSEELQLALDREAAEARKAMSAEALAFAEVVGPLGAKLDEALAAFKKAYTDLKARMHAAEQRGYGPSGEVVQSALTQSLRSALWRFNELGIESPHAGLGRSFSSLTTSWAGAARGGAVRLLAPPGPVPKPNGANGSSRLPKQTDVGERFADDDPAFTVKDPTEGVAR
jgi:hypothetical protein